MSADFDEHEHADVRRVAAELFEAVANGEVRAVAVVIVHPSGGLQAEWGAARSLGPHGGSILRGAVCWLGAEMDAKARST